jgi:divalent metal cation (Fe/Co/Zn/Cd) transporter
VLIVVAALLIVHEAIGGLLEPAGLMRRCLVWQSMASAAVINGVWAAVLIRCRPASPVAGTSADGHHILSDVVTSVGVIFGLGLAIWPSISRGSIRCWR